MAATVTTSYGLTVYNNSAGTETIYTRNLVMVRCLQDATSGANDLNVEILSSGSDATFASNGFSKKHPMVRPQRKLDCVLAQVHSLRLAQINLGSVFKSKALLVTTACFLAANGDAFYSGKVNVGDLSNQQWLPYL